MYSQRIAVRSTRAVRVNAPALRRRVRFASSESAGNSSSSGTNHALVGGLAGGGAALSLIYLWYQFSGLKTAVKTSKQAKSYIDSATEKLKVEFKERTPEPNEALDQLKQTAIKYATFIPGGRSYVDKAFKDLDTVRNKHGSEVDNIVSDAYNDLRESSKKGLNLEAMTDIWNVLSHHLQRISELAADAGQDILNNHPELKDKLGGSFDQLKGLGDRLGPEARKQVNETWKEVQSITQQGIQWNTVDRVRSLIQERIGGLKQLGDQVWKESYEQIKPTLEKSPQVKQLVEQNMDTLKSGNIMEAIDKVKNAVQSGNAGDLQKYIDK